MRHVTGYVYFHETIIIYISYIYYVYHPTLPGSAHTHAGLLLSRASAAAREAAPPCVFGAHVLALRFVQVRERWEYVYMYAL
jgi:hypothetical protein